MAEWRRASWYSEPELGAQPNHARRHTEFEHMRRRRTRRRVQDTLRSDRSADSRTGAGANAAPKGREKQCVIRTTPPCRLGVTLAEGVPGDDKSPIDGSDGESGQSTLDRVATALRDPRHIRGGPLTRAVVH